MDMGLWDFAKKVKNDRGEVEKDIWSMELSEIKGIARKREVERIMFTEAWIGRWDLFSYKVYGSADLWWVVPAVNGITNPFVEPVVGVVVEVVHKYDVLEWLLWRK